MKKEYCPIHPGGCPKTLPGGGLYFHPVQFKIGEFDATTKTFTPMTPIESIIKEFEEKYQSFELSEVIDKKSFERTKSFLRTALEKVESETAKAFGGCNNCYGKGYATTRIGTASRYHSEIHEEMRFCSCSRGKDLEVKIQKIAEKEYAAGQKEMFERMPYEPWRKEVEKRAYERGRADAIFGKEYTPSFKEKWKREAREADIAAVESVRISDAWQIAFRIECLTAIKNLNEPLNQENGK